MHRHPWLLRFFVDDLLNTFYRFLVVKLISSTGSTIFQTLIFNCLWRRDMRPGCQQSFYVSYNDIRDFMARKPPPSPTLPHSKSLWESLLECSSPRKPPQHNLPPPLL